MLEGLGSQGSWGAFQSFSSVWPNQAQSYVSIILPRFLILVTVHVGAFPGMLRIAFWPR